MKRIIIWILFVTMCGTTVFAQDALTPKISEDNDNYLISRGLSVIVRLGNTLDSRNTKKGEVVLLITTQLIPLSNHLALPQGLKIQADVERVERPGHIKGRALILIHPTHLELNEHTSVPFILDEVRPVEKALGDTYYRQLGDRNLISPSGRIRFAGQNGNVEDRNEILRNPLSIFMLWMPTILKRGPELIIDQGFPLIMTLGEDLKIPKGSVEVIEIVPMCPCENKKNSSPPETFKLGAK